MKRIVIYYSLEGNTKKAARMIANELGADKITAVFTFSGSGNNKSCIEA